LSVIDSIREDLQKLANPEMAKTLQRFFKTGPGQYGESDNFLGIIVPESRKVAKKYNDISLEEVKIILSSGIHEERLVALLILIEKFKHAGNDDEKQKIVEFYLGNLKQINNWDLVDLSAPSILGMFLMINSDDRSILYRLAKSESVWERRVAIVATLQFIRNNEFTDTLKIAEILLYDEHDLIHKAAGWMLREVGKRNTAAEEAFLKRYCQTMPRTMLRYAVERLSERKRKSYMRRT